MDDHVERRVMELLRDTRGESVPLKRLHGRLIAEAGPTVGTYARFADEIRRSRAFVVIEPDDPLGDGRDWPTGLRRAYETALADAGVERGPRLALASPVDVVAYPDARRPDATQADHAPAAPSDVAPLAVLQACLLDAWDSAGRHTGLREALASAFADFATMARALKAGDAAAPTGSGPGLTDSVNR